VPPPQTAGKKRRRTRESSHSGDQTSTQELALAKALKPSKKFSSRGSGLSLIEKASTVKVRNDGGKASLPRTGVSGVGMTSKALDLFESASPASEDEVAAPAPVPHQKHPQKSPSENFLNVFRSLSHERYIYKEIVTLYLYLLYLTFVLSSDDF
jgi:hypothetical protein